MKSFDEMTKTLSFVESVNHHMFVCRAVTNFAESYYLTYRQAFSLVEFGYLDVGGGVTLLGSEEIDKQLTGMLTN